MRSIRAPIPRAAPRRRLALLGAALLGTALPSAACSGESITVELLSADSTVRRWDRFEASLRLSVTPANPFDDGEIDVEADFVAPDGAHHTVPAFYDQRFTRALVSGAEVLTVNGDPAWKVRFSPSTPGSWRWSLSVRSGELRGSTPEAALEVTAPDPARHGLVRVCASDTRYLCFEDGTSLFAVGENLAWYVSRGTYDYDDWLKKLAAQGVNYIRLWMPSWAFGLEVVERDASKTLTSTTLGDYRTRLGQAWELDHVLEKARAAGMVVMLSIQAHGEFSLTYNSVWDDSPYNQANGGPLGKPEEFFTSAEAERLFKRRLRYIVARWSSSDAILAWELFNEVDLTEERHSDVLVAWHEEMAAELARLDPAAHLVTTSVSFLGDLLRIGDALFSSKAIAFAQVHRYGDAIASPADFTKVLPDLVALQAMHDKPVLLGEIGADSRGPTETLQNDPKGIALHDILWSGLFSFSTGTGMTWWWDSVVDPQNWYFHFGPVAAFVRGISFGEEAFALGKATASADGLTLEAKSLVGKRTVLVWVKNAKNQWKSGGDSTVIAGASLTLEGLANGAWTLGWLDPYEKIRYGRTQLVVKGGTATLAVPTFSKDIALRLWK
jgi:hypothetical protein